MISMSLGPDASLTIQQKALSSSGWLLTLAEGIP